MIPIQRQTAMRAIMPTNREGFLYLLAALAALLTCSTGINLHELRTSLFCFVSQHVQKAGPAGVADCPSQPAVPQHVSHVKAFHSEQTICKDQTIGYLIVVFASAIANPSMNDLETASSLAAVYSSPLFAGYRTTGNPQLWESGFEVSRIRLVPAVACCQKRFQPNVDANGGQCGRFNRNVRQLTRRNDVPLAGLPLDCDRLDCAFGGTVQLDTNHANVLHSQPVALQANAVTVGGELDAIEIITAAKPGITGLGVAFLDPPKEVGKRLVEPTHRGLGAGEVQASKIRVAAPLVLEPSRAIAVGDSGTVLSISQLPIVQAGVVEPSMRFQHDGKLPLLIGVGEQPVLKRPKHLFALLASDVSSDFRITFCHAGHCTDYVPARQLSRQGGGDSPVS